MAKGYVCVKGHARPSKDGTMEVFAADHWYPALTKKDIKGRDDLFVAADDYEADAVGFAQPVEQATAAPGEKRRVVKK